jgi:hypothetical protein
MYAQEAGVTTELFGMGAWRVWGAVTETPEAGGADSSLH